MRIMKEDSKIQEFSLFGGPLHRLGCRLGLVREETNSRLLVINKQKRKGYKSVKNDTSFAPPGRDRK